MIQQGGFGEEAPMFTPDEFVSGSDVRFLAVASAYAVKLGLVEEIDMRIPSRSDVSC